MRWYQRLFMPKHLSPLGEALLHAVKRPDEWLKEGRYIAVHQTSGTRWWIGNDGYAFKPIKFGTHLDTIDDALTRRERLFLWGVFEEQVLPYIEGNKVIPAKYGILRALEATQQWGA